MFRDGLGRRARTVDAAGVELEVLCLRPELSTAAAEAALRERVQRLANFRSGAFAKIRTVQRLNDAAATLALVSVATPGIRLSDLLITSSRLGVPLDGSAGWALLMQLASAMAHLHEHAPDVSHGALSPERIVVTPDARVMVVEHVLSGALETLKWTQDLYWREQRIATSASGRPLDLRGDVTQVGIVALSIAHGRSLTDDEYPSALAQLVESASITSVSGGREPMGAGLRLWLDRTLQLDDRRSFASAIEASAELHQLLTESDSVVVPLALESFLARLQKAVDRDKQSGTGPGPSPTPPSDDSSMGEPASAMPASPRLVTETMASSELTAAEPSTESPVAPAPEVDVLHLPGRIANPALQTLAVASEADRSAHAVPFDAKFATPDRTTGEWREKPWSRQAMAAAILTVVCGVGWVAASRLFADDAAPAVLAARDTTSPATSESVPMAAPVPATEDVPTPAIAVIEPAVVSTAPSNSTSVAPAPAAAPPPAAGWVTIRAPHNLAVFENGVLVGTTRGGRLTLPPGTHQFELVSEELGYRGVQTVEIKSGVGESVEVTLPNGTLSLNATPWAEVLVDGRSVGETPIGNLTISAGPHEIIFRHPELGEQRMTAMVTVNGPTRLTADMRKQP